ncbi:uncharacterized protein FIBRA_02500 [Fibroporia radiculosa]|uniref:WW domain-containing protein n=1 Tax=Fibroporia radiculosa TaxID=599839 RepID=J4HV16_9APHY|nr:uncharacterized protein FIBRA_02500 [Fibroporia radiculosa]CCM00467.1 predicted protein [Fibroporia radiculosa]
MKWHSAQHDDPQAQQPGSSSTAGPARFRDRVKNLARPRKERQQREDIPMIQVHTAPTPSSSHTAQDENGAAAAGPSTSSEPTPSASSSASSAPANGAPVSVPALPRAGSASTSPAASAPGSWRARVAARVQAEKRGATVDKRMVEFHGKLLRRARAVGGTQAYSVGHGWRRYVHLEGDVYYYHPEHRLVTPDDVENGEQRKAVEDAAGEFWDELEQAGITDYIPDDYELVMSVDEEGPTRADLVCRRTGQLFKCNPSKPGIIEQVHTYAYWVHVNEFPMHAGPLPISAEVEFLNALTYGANEAILGDEETTFPYTDQQMEQFMRLYRHQKKVSSNPYTWRALTYLVGTTLAEVQNRRMGSARKGTAGTYGSAFDMHRARRADASSWQLAAAQYLLMAVLLGAHRMYFARLRKTRNGATAYLLDFREVLRQFVAEWTDSNLLATVFVGGNIAFQQVPGISNLQRTASLASAILSLLSVATGVYHVWQHRPMVNADITNAVKYLNHAGSWESRFRLASSGAGTAPTSTDADLLPTAAFLAVPFAALLWAMLTFTLALAALCVQNSAALLAPLAGGGGGATVPLLAGVLGVFGLLALATLVFFRHIWAGAGEGEGGGEGEGESQHGGKEADGAPSVSVAAPATDAKASLLKRKGASAAATLRKMIAACSCRPRQKAGDEERGQVD